MMTLFAWMVSIIYISQVFGAPPACTWQSYKECSGNMIILGRQMAPYLTNDQLQDLCSTWDTAAQCVEDMSDACKVEATTSQPNSGEGTDEQKGDNLNVQEGSLLTESTRAPPTSGAVSTSSMGEGAFSEMSSTEDGEVVRRDADMTTAAQGQDTTVGPQSTEGMQRNDGPQSTTTMRRSTRSAFAEPTTVAYSAEDQLEVMLEKKRTSQALVEMQSGYGYLCDRSKKTVYTQSVRTCLDNVNGTWTTLSNDCLKTHHEATWWLNITDPLNVYKFCGAATKYLDCQEKAAKESCGEDVAIWIREYHTALWKPHMDDISCIPGGGMEAGALAIVSICASAAGLSVIFVAASFIVKPKAPNKKGDGDKPDDKDEKRQSNGSVTDLEGNERNTRNGIPAKENGLPSVPEHGILKHRTPSQVTSDVTPL